jgi:hypothetical protein
MALALTHKDETRLDRLAGGKHASLFRLFISDKEKCFMVLATGFNIIKLFSL